MVRILLYEFHKNKKAIMLYVVSCIFLAVTGGFLTSAICPVFVHAAPVSTGETIWKIAQSVFGTSVAAFAGSYANLVGVSCEPFAALLFIGILENINRWLGYPFQMASTPMGNIWVLLVVAIFFAISKLLKANEATEIFGMITLGELEKYTGFVFVIVIAVMNVIGVTSVHIQAAGTGVASSGGGGLIAVLTGIVSLFFAFVSVIVFFIIKTVMKGLDILQMSLSFIPGITLVVEVLKTVLTCTIIFINVICPPLGIAINLIIFIICCLLFRYCYRATQYFKKIYAKPFFRMIRGFDPHISLVPKRLPRGFRKAYKNMELPDIMLPAYPLKYLGNQKVRRYEKWYMVVEDKKTEFRRYRLFKKHPLTVACDHSQQSPVFMRKGLRYFEVFRYIDTQENVARRFPRKEYSFVFSKEYFYRHEEILSVSGFADYAVFKQERKQERQQIREAKRIQRQEKRMEKRMLREEQRLARQEARYANQMKERGLENGKSETF